MDHASSDSLSMNDSGTCEKIDTRLTQRRSPTVRGFVYFIRADQYIKIGFSTRPLDRLRALQTAHPEELEIIGTREASRDLETELHAHFAEYRVRGEWFYAVDSIMDYVEENTPEGREAAAVRPAEPPKSPLSEAAKEMIAQLIRVRSAHGAETVIGHACSNLTEQIENMADYVRPAWATHETQTLPFQMDYQMKRIEAARAAAN